MKDKILRLRKDPSNSLKRFRRLDFYHGCSLVNRLFVDGLTGYFSLIEKS